MSFHFPRVHAEVLRTWLLKSRLYAIEYGGFLSNHLTHNMVAIAASEHSVDETEKRLQWWYNVYTPKLERIASSSAGAHSAITESNWQCQQLCDNCELYVVFLTYYDECLRSNDVTTVLNQHVPMLQLGLSGAALHPLIHTGWAIEASAYTSMLAEGLAYMSCRYVPLLSHEVLRMHCPALFGVSSSWGPTPSSCATVSALTASLDFLYSAQTASLSSAIASAALREKYQQLPIGSFQRRVRAFADNSAARDALIANTLSDTHAGNFLTASPTHLTEELMAIAAAAYLASDCEFFVLHGVTSLHAAFALSAALGPNTIAARQLLMLWLHAELAVYTCQGTPGSETLVTILQLHSRCTREEDSRALDELCAALAPHSAVKFTDEWWRSVLNRSQQCEEEHVSKVVYVMWRWAHMADISPATSLLCGAAVANQMKEKASGRSPEDNIWFSNGV